MIAIRKCPRCHKVFDVIVEKTNHPYCDECWSAINFLADFERDEVNTPEEKLTESETSFSPEEYAAVIAAAQREREKHGGELPGTFDDKILNLGSDSKKQRRTRAPDRNSAVPYGHVELDEETMRLLDALPPIDNLDGLI